MNDTQKINAIKQLVEKTTIQTIEDTGELLSDIIHIVYGIDKTENCFRKRTLWHRICLYYSERKTTIIWKLLTDKTTQLPLR